jgi:DNA-binding MarR family transcriptional regulator
MRTKAGREAWRAIYTLILGQGHDRLTETSAAVGISPGMLKTLFHLEPGVGVPMRDLAGHWKCDASYVTNLTDMLEDRGLVERRPHPTDRRVKMIVLTDRGIAVRATAFDRLSEPPPSFGVLTAAEQRQLRDLLLRVTEADAGPSGRPVAAVR